MTGVQTCALPISVPTGPSPTWEASAPGGESSAWAASAPGGEPSAWAASAPAEADATRETTGGTPPAAPSPDREPPARKGLLRLWDHAWKHRRSVEDIFDRDEAEDDEGEGDEYTY